MVSVQPSARSRVVTLVTDLKAFRRVCHEAACETGAEVAEFRISNEPTPNFHQGIIAYPDRTLAVVCVRDTPFWLSLFPASSSSRRRTTGVR